MVKYHDIPCNSMVYHVIPWYIFIRVLAMLNACYTGSGEQSTPVKRQILLSTLIGAWKSGKRTFLILV